MCLPSRTSIEALVLSSSIYSSLWSSPISFSPPTPLLHQLNWFIICFHSLYVYNNDNNNICILYEIPQSSVYNVCVYMLFRPLMQKVNR